MGFRKAVLRLYQYNPTCINKKKHWIDNLTTTKITGEGDWKNSRKKCIFISFYLPYFYFFLFFPTPIPPPTSHSTRSLWVFPVDQVQTFVSCINKWKKKMKETTVKINKTESWFFLKIKILTRLQWARQKKRERNKNQTNKTRNEKEEITTENAEIQRTVRDYYEYL